MNTGQALETIANYLAQAMARGLGRNGLVFPLECSAVDDRAGQDFCKILAQIFTQCNEAYSFAQAIANGELQAEVSRANIFAMPLKALQASLRHLTWQANQVAAGDLNQQVDFLGEFSLAFNHLIEVLRDKETLQNKYQESLQTINALLEKQATTDPLTGIFNRLKFTKLLEVEICRAQRYKSPLGIIMFDIDKFKQINDSYGHQAGDSVLVDIARVIKANVRTTDVFARWGGEEFMIIAPGCRLEQSRQFADMLRLRVGQHPFSVLQPVTASFGVAAFKPDDTEISLTNRADQALYRAKADGRNRVEVEE